MRRNICSCDAQCSQTLSGKYFQVFTSFLLIRLRIPMRCEPLVNYCVSSLSVVNKEILLNLQLFSDGSISSNNIPCRKDVFCHLGLSLSLTFVYELT